ncbi:hypothetical protein BH20CHL6_BH20CHL6_13860 [soil metagenome]
MTGGSRHGLYFPIRQTVGAEGAHRSKPWKTITIKTIANAPERAMEGS